MFIIIFLLQSNSDLMCVCGGEGGVGRLDLWLRLNPLLLFERIVQIAEYYITMSSQTSSRRRTLGSNWAGVDCAARTRDSQIRCTFHVRKTLLSSKYITRPLLASHTLTLLCFVFLLRAALRFAAINVASFVSNVWTVSAWHACILELSLEEHSAGPLLHRNRHPLCLKKPCGLLFTFMQ